MLLLANVNVARAAITCAPAPAHAGQLPAEPPAAHDHADHEPSVPAQDAPAPDVAECCQAMTSCVSVVDVATAEMTGVPGIDPDEVARAVVVPPVSRTSAPDSPPPRG